MHTGDLMNNIVLIGLPAAGKSTLGVILAKTLGLNFIDTDIVIQERTGRLLQDIIDREGPAVFKAIEEQAILDTRFHHAVIATGGSVVFSKRAMHHLKSGGVAVYVKISFTEMEKRLKNITTRGIVLAPGESLSDMYAERIPLYEKYADITITGSGTDPETIVRDIITAVEKFPDRSAFQ